MHKEGAWWWTMDPKQASSSKQAHALTERERERESLGMQQSASWSLWVKKGRTDQVACIVSVCQLSLSLSLSKPSYSLAISSMHACRCPTSRSISLINLKRGSHYLVLLCLSLGSHASRPGMYGRGPSNAKALAHLGTQPAIHRVAVAT
jgi:hypothetical protein